MIVKFSGKFVILYAFVSRNCMDRNNVSPPSVKINGLILSLTIKNTLKSPIAIPTAIPTRIALHTGSSTFQSLEISIAVTAPASPHVAPTVRSIYPAIRRSVMPKPTIAFNEIPRRIVVKLVYEKKIGAKIVTIIDRRIIRRSNVLSLKADIFFKIE